MIKLPLVLQQLIESFQRLPGIGPKTAERLTFYLTHVPQSELDRFADALLNLKTKSATCQTCFNIADSDPCLICSSQDRDKNLVCVVEQPLDLLAIEKAGSYKGVYHILQGAVNPLNNIGPDELRINELSQRVKTNGISEVILATNPNMEGEATALYIKNELLKIKNNGSGKNIRITRLAHGLPMGADVEFADSLTLSRAIDGRREF